MFSVTTITFRWTVGEFKKPGITNTHTETRLFNKKSHAYLWMGRSVGPVNGSGDPRNSLHAVQYDQLGIEAHVCRPGFQVMFISSSKDCVCIVHKLPVDEMKTKDGLVVARVC